MADVEEPQFNTLAERIAALKKQQQNFQNGAPAAPDGPRKRPPPPPPPGRPTRTQTGPVAATDVSRHQMPPQIPQRHNSANPSGPPPLPRREMSAIPPNGPAAQDPGRPAPPPLPSRSATSSLAASQPSPALPPRRTLTQPANALSARRNSGSSEASTRSNLSSLSLAKTTSSSTSLGSGGTAQRKLPPPCDLASLPPLPPTRRELEAQAREAASQDTAAGHAAQRLEAPASSTQPKLPPNLPSRLVRSQTEVASTIAAQPAEVTLRPNRVLGFNHRSANGNAVPRVPARPKFDDDDAPPPVPVTSRPSAAQIEAISSRPPPAPPAQADCWTCRDWSGPDGVAARFPRESLPRNDPIGYLARGLCDPFPSYTDKARAIFTWFHHNIMYDTVAFFANNVGPQTPERTILTGVAVCAGYAETYKAIAVRAGLECVVVGGHGKGFGYTALRKGERPPPPKPDGHAWNAVRVDGGDWKLIDACWGAGHICSAVDLFKKEFHPMQFAAPNDVFARTHFPADPRYQFRNDGRVMSWEEYCIGPCEGPPVEVYSGTEQEGIAEESIEPRERHLSANRGRMVRFQFSKVCEHWTSEGSGLGPPPLLLLLIQLPDGSVGDMMPLETDGFWHWLDVHERDLGGPGHCVFVIKLIRFGDREGKAARGVSNEEFAARRGRVAMAWSTLMKWEVQ